MMAQQLVLQQRKQKVITNTTKNTNSKLPSIPQKSPVKRGKLDCKPKVRVRGNASATSSLPKIAAEGEKDLVEPSVFEVATQKLNSPPNLNDNSCGNVVIHFNHYHKSFPIHNGVLKWEDIDREYYLSFAYSGNFKRTITLLPRLVEGENLYKRNAALFAFHSGENPSHELLHDEGYCYFLGAADQEEYLLKVEEDSTTLSKSGIKLDPLHPPASNPTIKSGNKAVSDLTAELKSLSPQNLNSEHAKELIEQRDLEDILFSSYH